jgi:hypothetical protein
MKNDITLPIKIYVTVSETIDEHVVEWMEANRDTVLRGSMIACRELCEDEEAEELIVLEIHEDDPLLEEHLSLIAVVTIDRVDIEGNLEECENYFVSIEDYEAAEEVLEIRNLYNKK